MRKSGFGLAHFVLQEGKVILMDTANQFLGTERVGKLMGKYAVPCVISLLVGALYNIVDQIFIANASYLGSYGNAANTVVFPLTVVALAIAVLVGDGCCAFVSICLGRKELQKARRSVGNAVILAVAASLALTAVYLIFADAIIAMFGGTVNADTFRYAQEYFFYISLGIPFYMFGQAMNPIIRADGNPRFAMVSTLAGAVINIILDPVFIFVCQWGMMGAAVATVIGQIATAILSARYLLYMRIIRPEPCNFALQGNLCGRMLTLGITSFLSQISLVAAMAAINNMLRQYGALDLIFVHHHVFIVRERVVGVVNQADLLVFLIFSELIGRDHIRAFLRFADLGFNDDALLFALLGGLFVHRRVWYFPHFLLGFFEYFLGLFRGELRNIDPLVSERLFDGGNLFLYLRLILCFRKFEACDQPNGCTCDKTENITGFHRSSSSQAHNPNSSPHTQIVAHATMSFSLIRSNIPNCPVNRSFTSPSFEPRSWLRRCSM